VRTTASYKLYKYKEQLCKALSSAKYAVKIAASESES
jgi:hypothetical protein